MTMYEIVDYTGAFVAGGFQTKHTAELYLTRYYSHTILGPCRVVAVTYESR